MNNPFSPSDPAWARDTLWTCDAAGDFEPSVVNVAGVTLISRYPADHPLHEMPCGILITCVTGHGYARNLWYN